MRPREGLWLRVNTDGEGRHALSVELDEALGCPRYIGWDVQGGRLYLWPARDVAYDRVAVTRPWNGRVRQFRSRQLARLVPPGRYEVALVGRWAIAHF